MTIHLLLQKMPHDFFTFRPVSESEIGHRLHTRKSYNSRRIACDRFSQVIFNLVRMLMIMSIKIASVLSHRVSQEAVDTCEQLISTLIRLTMQTDAGIVVTS